MRLVARFISYLLSVWTWFFFGDVDQTCHHGYSPYCDGVCPYCVNNDAAFLVAADEDHALEWLKFLGWHCQDVRPLSYAEQITMEEKATSVFLCPGWEDRPDRNEILDTFLDTHATFYQIDQYGNIHKRGEDVEA